MNKGITVVTVSYNAKDLISRTIQSVINQTYKNLEYIIIDGGSNDGTIDIIKSYASRITCWISEKDNGIYDAMNKGINMAHNEWIIFMNCGDFFYANEVLEDVSRFLNDNVDIVYGNSLIKVNATKFVVLPEDLRMISKHLPFCHQCVFTRTELIKEFNFNLNYKYVADYKMFYDFYKSNKRFKYIDILISYYETNSGFTAFNSTKMLYEISMVNGMNISKIQLVLLKLREKVLKLLPYKCLLRIREQKYLKLKKRFKVLM